MQSVCVDKNHYINITPTKDFQISHYKERPWVPNILEGCSDKEKAFDNWMNRDALFANYVRNQSIKIGYKTILIDGATSAENICREINLALCLKG